MSDVVEIDITPVDEKTKKKTATPKAPKPKKRMADFEIVRTLLQRGTERKLPYLLHNMHDNPDIFVLCSESEDGFLFGSNTLTLGLFQFEDDSLRMLVDEVLSKVVGTDLAGQAVINLRDQISALVKTKGESLDVPVESNEDGTAWIRKRDINDKETLTYFVKRIDSLFHFHKVSDWVETYSALLSGYDPNKLYIPYNHGDGDTYTLVKIDTVIDIEHPISKLFPNGLRYLMTRGIDAFVTKHFKDVPWPIVKEEMIVSQVGPGACSVCHRVQGEGWSMVLVRPNCLFFTTANTPIATTGNHVL